MPQIDKAERISALKLSIGYYRRYRGLTQEELAEKVGISRQHLVAIESPNMKRGLSIGLLFDIAAALDIEPYQFFKVGPFDK